MNPKELRLKELTEKYNRPVLIENLRDYHLLVDTLLYLHESVAEQKVVRYWQKDSETLFYKFAFHGFTLHQILNGLDLSSVYYKEAANGKRVIDISSARTVLRTQFEAFLMYHHIYVNPGDDDLKELRYNAWIYSSLLQRQGFPAKTEFAKKQKDKDLIELSKMKDRIAKLKSFQNLSTNQQKSLLDSGSGKLFNHWSTILKETGFSERNPFHTIYTLLSIHSHSEGLSIIQLSNKLNYKDTIIQANLDLNNSKILVCLMINSIVSLHEAVKKKYEMLTDVLKYDIEIYSDMAKEKP